MDVGTGVYNPRGSRYRANTRLKTISAMIFGASLHNGARTRPMALDQEHERLRAALVSAARSSRFEKTVGLRVKGLVFGFKRRSAQKVPSLCNAQYSTYRGL